MPPHLHHHNQVTNQVGYPKGANPTVPAPKDRMLVLVRIVWDVPGDDGEPFVGIYRGEAMSWSGDRVSVMFWEPQACANRIVILQVRPDGTGDVWRHDDPKAPEVTQLPEY